MYPHFTGEETEVQGGDCSCSVTHLVNGGHRGILFDTHAGSHPGSPMVPQQRDGPEARAQVWKAAPGGAERKAGPEPP